MGNTTTFTELIAEPASEKVFLLEVNTAQQVTTDWSIVLNIQNTVHSHTANVPELIRNDEVNIRNTVHNHTANNVAITRNDELNIQNPVHHQTVKPVTLTTLDDCVFEIAFLTKTITLADGTTETIRKEVSSVEEDGVALLERSSVDSVRLHSGTYWHDTVNGKLYIHPTDNADPDTHITIAFFWLYFGTHGKILSSRYYEPYIAERGIPSLSQKNLNVHWGVSNIGSGSIKLLNGRGYFDQISKDFIWTNKTAKLLMGGDNLPYSEYQTLFTGKIRDKTFTKQMFTLKLKSMAFDLLRTLPINNFWTTDYPNLDENAEGMPIPYFYGSYSAAQAPVVTCIDTHYGTDYPTNGDMELDANWSNYGTPTTNEQSTTQVYEGSYSRKFVSDGAGDGIQSDTFTTVTGKTYRVTLQVYPDDTTSATITIRKGDASGNVYDTAHTLTQDSWNEITFDYTETAGGAGAYIAIHDGAGDTGTWYVDDVVIWEPTYQFKICDHAIKAITQVYVEYDDGEGWNTISHANEDLTNATFTIVSTDFVVGTSRVKVSFDGKHSGGTLIENPPNIVEDILLSYCGYSASDLHTSSFTTSKSRTEMTLNVPIEKETKALSIIERICMSDLAFFDEDGDGKLRYRTWEPELGSPPVLDETDILEKPLPTIIDDTVSLFWKMKIGYSYLCSREQYLYAEESNAESRYKYEKEEIHIHETYLRSATDASRLGQRLLLVLQDPSPLLTIGLKATQITKTLGDKLKITLSRAPIDCVGGYSQRPFEIFGISKSFFPLTVKVRARDLPDYASNVGYWTEDTTPDYSAATEAQKATSGFWTDDNGYPDPTDADSLHKSRWW